MYRIKVFVFEKGKKMNNKKILQSKYQSTPFFDEKQRKHFIFFCAFWVLYMSICLKLCLWLISKLIHLSFSLKCCKFFYLQLTIAVSLPIKIFLDQLFFFFPICAVLPMPVFIFSCSSWDVETEKNMLLRTAAQRQQYIYLYFLTFFPSTLSVRANDYRFNFFGRSPFLHQKVYHALGFD